MTELPDAAVEALTRPIIGIENRTAQEAFDIMADRIKRAHLPAYTVERELREALEPFASQADYFSDIPGVVRTHDNVELWQQPNYRCPITVGDLRRARAALSRAPAPERTDEPTCAKCGRV